MRSPRCRASARWCCSDYAKGVLTPRVIRAVIDRAKKLRQAGDRRSRRRIDYSVYRGATIITPNRKELAEIHAACRLRHARGRFRRRRTSAVSDLVGSKAVLVTLSEDGMMLQCARAAMPIRVPAYPP